MIRHEMSGSAETKSELVKWSLRQQSKHHYYHREVTKHHSKALILAQTVKVTHTPFLGETHSLPYRKKYEKSKSNQVHLSP